MLFAQTATELTLAGVALATISAAAGWFMRVFIPSQQAAVATAETRTAGYIDKILGQQNITLSTRDALIERLMREDREEREKDRAARHELANKFQVAIAELAKQHIADAEKDRAAFLERNRGVEAAIVAQTQQLLLALRDTCKYRKETT